jgi:hypothetical protein
MELGQGQVRRLDLRNLAAIVELIGIRDFLPGPPVEILGPLVEASPDVCT